MKKEDQGGTEMSQREAGTCGRREPGLRVTVRGRVDMPTGQGKKDSRRESTKTDPCWGQPNATVAGWPPNSAQHAGTSISCYRRVPNRDWPGWEDHGSSNIGP